MTRGVVNQNLSLHLPTNITMVVHHYFHPFQKDRRMLPKASVTCKPDEKSLMQEKRVPEKGP